MNTLFNRLAGCPSAKATRRLESLLTGRQECLPHMAALLLAALPLSAATTTSFTSTGWVTGLLSPGIVCANAQGQVIFRANIHTARVESTDARVTGNRLIIVHGAYNADGTANLQGTCYQQVGTWDAGTNFTATGGLWEISYQGVMRTDNSLLLTLVGYGCGGAIDGMRLEETLTRAPAASSGDPTVPYLYTGTLKPAPVNTTEVVDNFDDNHFTGNIWGKGTVIESNQQFNVRGSFAGAHTTSIFDSWVGGSPKPNMTWSVPDGMTREWRADLVSLDNNATNVAILLAGNDTRLYAFHKGSHFAYLLKWRSFGFSIFACETVAVRNTNVVLALALTRVQTNMVITARVLDKADPNTVLYQLSAVDTPDADPTLTRDQFQALTGMRWVDLIPDNKATPFTSFNVLLGLFQYTDGKQPAPTAVFDNLELRTYEVPRPSISLAAMVTWPDVGHYSLEGGPTVNGPWLPVQVTLPPGMNQMTVPLNDMMKFFRLQWAP